jgi:hypothetical protein
LFLRCLFIYSKVDLRVSRGEERRGEVRRGEERRGEVRKICAVSIKSILFYIKL